MTGEQVRTILTPVDGSANIGRAANYGLVMAPRLGAMLAPLLGRTCRTIVLAAILATVTFGGAAEAAEPVGPELTPKLRGLLIKEMAQVVAAMQEVYGAIVRGDHAVVAKQAQAIHDSFILDQSLTQEDRQDLKSAVPPTFLEMDQRFHELAASLAKAGRERSARDQVIYFNRMTQSCVACHSRYVTDRFPGMVEQQIPKSWAPEPGKE